MAISRPSKAPTEQSAQQSSATLRLSDGTDLSIGAVADGEILTRSGASIVGSAAQGAAGNTGEVQWNNAGSLAGATKTKVLGGGHLSHEREQEIKLVTDPATAAGGYLHLYGANRANRGIPGFRSDIGGPVTLQPSLFGRRMHLLQISTTALQTNGNWAWTASANTNGRVALAANATNRLAATTKWQYVSSAATNAVAGIRTNGIVCMRGSSAGCGGFFFYARFGLDAAPGGECRFFVGLTAQSDTSTVSGDPSGVANSVGLYKDAGDTNYGMLCRDGSNSEVVDLGFAPALNDLLDVYIWAEPNGTTVTVAVHDVNAGSLAGRKEFSDYPPDASTGLRGHILGGPGTGTTAVSLCVVSSYLETEL